MPRISSTAELNALREELVALRDAKPITVTICGGTGCQACGCKAVVEAVRAELARQRLSDRVRLRVTGCHGFCEQGPLTVIEPGNIFYCHLRPEDAADIVSKTIGSGEVIEKLLYTDPVNGEKIRTEAQIPFYAAQDRVLLRQNQHLDPHSIDDYIAQGGYSAMAKVLGRAAPEEVIRQVKASGLKMELP